MNDQEMQPPERRNIDVDPREQAAYNPQSINTDPREQSQWQEALPSQQAQYGEGYMGTRPYVGPQAEKIGVQQPGRPRQHRRSSPLFWIILVLIILAIAGARSGPAFGNFGGSSNVTETHPFTSFSGTPTIVINDNSGNIHVHTGTDGGVSIQATKHTSGIFGNSDNIHVNYKQIGDIVDVNVDNGSRFFFSGSVDFDVTVPTNTDLKLKTDSGNIDASNVNGQISLAADSGSITTSQDTFNGSSALSTDSGSITTSQDTFNGPATLTTDSGSVNATRDTLNESSLLKTDSGSVTFSGSIGTSGTYQFETDSGSVNVSLPSNANFHVDAKTDSGPINSDFSQVTIQNNDSGAEAHGNVGGTAPNATVTLKTSSGAINLDKQ